MQRVLSQRGFELANGLPFVASDVAMHCLLAEHTVVEAQRLQVALGQIRRASGDYVGKLLAIDPHRIRSYSKRQMRRYRDDQRSRPFKVAQTFFVLDPDTHQPVCFTTGTSARAAVRPKCAPTSESYLTNPAVASKKNSYSRLVLMGVG